LEKKVVVRRARQTDSPSFLALVTALANYEHLTPPTL